MIIVTTNDLPDYKIDAIFGEVMGLTVRSRHIGAQFTASFRTLGGGELPELTQALDEGRQEVMAHRVTEAQTKVANGTAVYTMPRGEGQSGATGQSTYLALNPQG